MKRTTSTLIVIAIIAVLFSFKKDSQPPPKDHEYTVKGTLQQFVFINNYLSKTQEMLTRTSSLPSKDLMPEIDTLNMIKNLIFVQVQSQFTTFQKEDIKQDSIDNAKKKK